MEVEIRIEIRMRRGMSALPLSGPLWLMRMTWANLAMRFHVAKSTHNVWKVGVLGHF